MWRCRGGSFRIYLSDGSCGPFGSRVDYVLIYLVGENFKGKKEVEKKELLLPTELL